MWPILGWSGVALGTVGTAVGIGLAAHATSLDDEADEGCGPTRCATRSATDAAEQASTFATAANVAIGVGLGLAAAGTLALVFGPDHDTVPTAVTARGWALAF